MPMLEQNSGTEIGNPVPQEASEQQQRRRMLVALCVLLLALISVLIKDRQFWFPPGPSAESETPEQSVPQSKPLNTPAKIATPYAASKHLAPAPVHARPKSKRPTAIATTTERQGGGMSPVITATSRAVLPPLEVEVVAGNQHRAVRPGDSSVKLDTQPSTEDASEQAPAPPPSQDNASSAPYAGAHVQLSPGAAQVVSRVDPSYPLLAKQMKVQGAVVLEALIGKTGSIQDIQVVSGPAILSEAAREAVKQWHFKPYYQGGRPVETEARITVNFTISTY
ncbi:MAG TPA: energy transducer TonB [Terriglobales bacterium]|nr:energy transducer TonB [Terriglobales bacterium]